MLQTVGFHILPKFNCHLVSFIDLFFPIFYHLHFIMCITHLLAFKLFIEFLQVSNVLVLIFTLSRSRLLKLIVWKNIAFLLFSPSEKYSFSTPLFHTVDKGNSLTSFPQLTLFSL